YPAVIREDPDPELPVLESRLQTNRHQQNGNPILQACDAFTWVGQAREAPCRTGFDFPCGGERASMAVDLGLRLSQLATETFPLPTIATEPSIRHAIERGDSIGHLLHTLARAGELAVRIIDRHSIGTKVVAEVFELRHVAPSLLFEHFRCVH